MDEDPFSSWSKALNYLNEISGESYLKNGLLRLAYKYVESVAETTSKVREPKTYDEVINNLIYRNRWREVVDKELLNLDI